EQLKSRLTMGLVTKMEAPDFETRVKILKKKSSLNGYKIPNDVADYIAQELCDNVRQLESGLAGVAAKGSLMGEPINLALARAVLENISKSRKQVTIDAIKKLICNEFAISEEDLLSTSRKSKLVHPRQMAIYLSRKYTDQPLKTIGKSFNRYHATAIYSINAVEKAIQQQGAFSEQLNYLYKKIEAGKF
ncbi:MAG: chromosomal replication initiator protein DnaA, partial [Desulfamplus sp.]|nr:chromosomal replication initiator protein DnaA [Desulfamplus sp.]